MRARPRVTLIHHLLGNLALIGFLRELLGRASKKFPILLEKVVYTGSHCGDYLDLPTVERLQGEMRTLESVHCDSPEDEVFVRTFERPMKELIQASLGVRKPIAF